MTSFFLSCFVFGLLFTVGSLVVGAFGAGGDAGGHLGHGSSAHVSPFSLSTLAAFLAWFGGAGWLLQRYSDIAAVLTVAVATGAGVVGGGTVFLVLARYVAPRLTEMSPADYDLTGVTARVSSPIREAGGTGEVVYPLAGTRRTDGARSETGEALEQGAEVVIVRVEKGIVYVKRWTQFAAENALPPGESGPA